VSSTVASKGWLLFWLIEIGFPVVLGADSRIDAGGQVEKKPAELAALATFAEIRTDPGKLAVATPFWSMLTTGDTDVLDVDPVAENCR
jgi:hypothetical protein